MTVGERRRALRRRKLVALVLTGWHRCSDCFHTKDRHDDGACNVYGCTCRKYNPRPRTEW